MVWERSRLRSVHRGRAGRCDWASKVTMAEPTRSEQRKTTVAARDGLVSAFRRGRSAWACTPGPPRNLGGLSVPCRGERCGRRVRSGPGVSARVRPTAANGTESKVAPSEGQRREAKAAESSESADSTAERRELVPEDLWEESVRPV